MCVCPDTLFWQYTSDLRGNIKMAFFLKLSYSILFRAFFLPQQGRPFLVDAYPAWNDSYTLRYIARMRATRVTVVRVCVCACVRACVRAFVCVSS